MHYGVYLENWTAPLYSPQNKHNFYRAILQYMHLFHIYEVKFKHFYLLRDGFKTSLPILPLQCLQRTGKYDTTRAVLISHSSSCEKDRDHETLRCLYPAGYIVKSFSGFHTTETYKIRPVTRSHYALVTKQQPRSQYVSHAVYLNTKEIKEKTGLFRTLHK